MFDVSRCSGSLSDHLVFDRSRRPPYHISDLRKLATIYMLSRLLQPHHLTLPHPLSFASLDTFGNEIAESPMAHRLLQHQLQVQVTGVGIMPYRQ